MIKIPDRLSALLSRNATLSGQVQHDLTEFAPWFRMSGMPFFPFFTDHGTGHVEDVLQTAESLITDGAWKHLTAEDAAVLILATLLHDSALHLREEGFVSLATGRWSTQPLEGFGDSAWTELWSDFTSEARRWDAKRLFRVFGSSTPPRIPPLAFDEIVEWTQRDRLLIGEFLRRHHHRLAHEIAANGVPGPPGQPPLAIGCDWGDFGDLAGLVARSHGVAVRSCIPYLEARYGDRRRYRGVHAVFLMVVLRVSDYLQIQSTRAPQQLLRVTSLRSPISAGEWSAHASVKDVSTVTEDPEALVVRARPDDVRDFLRLREWLDGIQAELDAGWAVLGEVYGRFAPLDELGVVLRRVRSNLDDVSAFAASVPYVPVRASFSTSDAALLKLLVAPLYGDRPEIGVRELIQNAVDATRERTSIDIDNPAGDCELTNLVRVSITKDASGAWLEVVDSGVGMTADVIRDYYLRAGASFRVSETWRKNFEDSDGNAEVLRSGRFGVGAVAAFLLGDRLEVTTRHVHVPPEAGIAFEAALDDDLVELRQTKAPVGTTIRVRLRDPVVDKLVGRNRAPSLLTSWDWFVLDTPKVERSALGNVLQQRFHLPNEHRVLAAPWHRTEHELFSDIHWTFSDFPALACNGILINDALYRRYYHDYGYYYDPDTKIPWTLFVSPALYYKILYPSLSVFDPNANLPLNLQRSGIVESQYPFTDALRDDVIDNIIARIAVANPVSAFDWQAAAFCGLEFRGGEPAGSVRWDPLFYMSSGIGFGDADIVAGAALQSAVITGDAIWRPVPTMSPPTEAGVGMFRVAFSGISGIHSLLRRLLYSIEDRAYIRLTPFDQRRLRGCRVLVGTESAATLNLRKKVSVKLRRTSRRKGWEVWNYGDCDEPSSTYSEAFAETYDKSQSAGGLRLIAELYFGDTPAPDRESAGESVLAKRWISAYGSAVVPPTSEARVRLLGSVWTNRIAAARADEQWIAREQTENGNSGPTLALIE